MEASVFFAASGSCGVLGSPGQCHFLFASVIGPWTGTAAPRYTVSAKSLRSTASEMAWRSSSRCSHAARGSLANAPGARLNHRLFGTRLTPRSYMVTRPASAARLSGA